MHTDTTTSALSLIKERFKERKRKDPNFSQRDMAKSLDLPPSSFTSILSKKRRLTLKTAKKIIPKLVSSKKIQQNILADIESSEKPVVRRQWPKKWKLLEESYAKAFSGNEDKPSFSKSQYEYCSDPRVITLLYLIECEDFKNDPKWIAERLDSKEDEIQGFFQVLFDLKLITFNGAKIVRTHINARTPQKTRTEALTTFRRRFLKYLEDGIELDRAESYFHNLTAPIDPEDLPKIKKDIEKIILRYNSNLKLTRPKKVYSFFTALVPMTK